MSAPRDALASIDPALLSDVSAGTHLSSSGDLAGTLNGLLDTIQSISRFQQRSGFSGEDTLLLMLLLQSNRRSVVAPVWPWGPPPVVYY